MSAREFNFDAWRDGNEVHVRGLLDPDVVSALTLDTAADVAHQLIADGWDSNRALGEKILDAIQGGAS